MADDPTADPTTPAGDDDRERPLRTSPFHDRQLALGAVVSASHGWAGIAWYEHNLDLAAADDVPDGVAASPAVGAEALATRDTVGCYDLTPHRPIEIRGPDAAEFVQSVFTNDMDMTVGAVRFALLLDTEAKVLGDLIVTRTADREFLAVASPATPGVTEWLRSHAAPGVTVVDRGSAYVGLGLWGPNARTVAQSLTDQDLSNDAFPVFTTQRFRLGGVPVTALRVSAVGELGWELWAPMEHGPTLWDELWAAGTNYGLVGLGDRAFTSLTAEKGNREWGTDVTADHSPDEAGLGDAVDMNTDFIGKSALQRLRDAGLTRRLACLTLDSRGPVPDVGAQVTVEDAAVGAVVRSEYGYSVDERIAFAYLPIEHASPGSGVVIETHGEQYDATVRAEPLFDSDNERMLK